MSKELNGYTKRFVFWCYAWCWRFDSATAHKRKVFFDLLAKGYGSEFISSKAQIPEKVASRDSNYLCREVVNG